MTGNDYLDPSEYESSHEPHHGPIDAYQLDPDHDEAFLANAENPIWQQENVTLHSVGIDIGSSGTQLVFSELKLQRNGAGLATRYVVIERICLFQSDVAFTPFTDSRIIDARALGRIIDEAYFAAGIKPETIDTGIVILTGEALRRQNAENIAMVVSEKAGDFVCATAGHHMEATLAAYGSGAVQASADFAKRILNIDIGGGTTKLSLIENGKIISTAALHIGGRLLVCDTDGKLVRLEEAATMHADTAGLTLKLGDTVDSNELDAITTVMVDTLLSALSQGRITAPGTLPYLTDPIADLSDIDGVIFSGGVGEYVYGNEERDFGDLGRRLGVALRERLDNGTLPYSLLPAEARIRATALGASEFCVQLSGNTCYISDVDKVLPRRNLQVVHPNYELDDDINVDDVAHSIRSHLEGFTTPEASSDIVVALTWTGELSYRRLHSMAEAITVALKDRIDSGHPLLLTFDADMGKSLGSLLHDELGVNVEILVVDGLTLWDFDYIDLGRPLQPSQTIPVTIKSLVF